MSALVTQAVVETLAKPTAAKLCLTQSAVEVLRRPTVAKACLSQMVTEVLRYNAATNIENKRQPLIIIVAG